MRKKYLPLAIALVILISSCGSRIDGSSAKKAKDSYEKMKKSLSDDEQSKLELAILYITSSAMYSRMNDDKEYKDMSTDAIVMKKIDGKTKGGIMDLGEECMKQAKEREIKSTKDEIAELNKNAAKERKAYNDLKQKLGALQGRFVKMTLENGNPVVYFQYKNVTANKMFDTYAISLVLRSAVNRDNIIWNSSSVRSGVGTVSPRDTLTEMMEITQYSRDKAPEIDWKAIKYPVTDLAKYKLIAEAKTTTLVIDDKEYSTSTVKWDDDAEYNYREKLKELNDKLKKAQNKPDNLDDELKRGS